MLEGGVALLVVLMVAADVLSSFSGSAEDFNRLSVRYLEALSFYHSDVPLGCSVLSNRNLLLKNSFSGADFDIFALGTVQGPISALSIYYVYSGAGGRKNGC